MATLNYPSHTTMVRNILREFRATSPADREAGASWYLDARELAREMALEYGVADRVAIGVIAALSPQTQWWQNVMLARQVLRTGFMVQGHTQDTIVKVNRIILGEAPLEVLGGSKVRSFARNIATGALDDWDHVTIDRHAWRTVCGRHELGKRNSVPSAGYALAVAAFIRAAQILNVEYGASWTPAQVQAIVWVPRAAR